MLAPGAFDRALNGALGQKLGWRKAFSCPCVSANSGAAAPACSICAGKGTYWQAEIVGTCGLSNQSQGKSFAQFGEWQPGDALLTIPETAPFYLAGQYDRFRALGSIERFSTALTPGLNDKLLGTIVAIDSVQWVVNNALVQGAIPTVNADGSLTFATGAPPANTSYVVNGTKSVEFFAYLALPASRNVGVSGLPRKLPIRRFDLFGR
jgi:hypothetical protein